MKQATLSPLAPALDRLDLLDTFLRIVEGGSLSAAAVQMGTSQPTVSRRLQALERLLGLRLLQRSTHAMTLTEAGERCVEHARHLIASWQAAEADLRGDRDVARGTLRVVAPHAFGQEQLMAPLAAFLQRHPQVSVDWLLYDRVPDFAAEGIDCAIHVGPVGDPGLVAVRLAEVPRIVVAAPGLGREVAEATEPQSLQSLPWLALRMYYVDDVRLRDETRKREARLTIRPRLATDNLLALRHAALRGLGVAIVSSWIVDDDLREGRLMHLVPDWTAAPLPVYLVHPRGGYQPARLRLFVEAMREHMPHLFGMQPPTRASAGMPTDEPAPPPAADRPRRCRAH